MTNSASSTTSPTPSGTPASTAAPTSTSPPLAKARKRLDRAEARERGRPPKRQQVPSPEFVSRVATLAAEGLGKRAIRGALRTTEARVASVLARPETQVEIAKRRELLKSVTIQRLGEVTEPAWDMVHEAAANRDAKSFDAATRGLHAMEKISASVSGENQRIQVEHSGTVDTTPAVEQLKVLIALVTNGPPR